MTEQTQPKSTSEYLLSSPRPAVAGLSALITSWFGTEHYLAKIESLRDVFQGLGGERLISSETVFMSELQDIVHYWKTDGGSSNHTYSPRQILSSVRDVANKYGFRKDAALADKLLNSGENWLNEKTLNGPGRQAIKQTFEAQSSRLFDLLGVALEPKYNRASKAKEKVMQNAANIYSYVREHNRHAINTVRNPLTLVATGAAVALTAKQIQKEDQTRHAMQEQLARHEGMLEDRETAEELSRPI